MEKLPWPQVVPLSCAAAGLLASWFGVGWMRAWASENLLDLPNERSSHLRPTPRGGGLMFLLPFLALYTTAWALGWHELSPTLALGTAGVAGIGWLDDRRPLHPAVRLAVHLACAAPFALAYPLSDFLPLPPLAGAAFSLLWIVSLLNLTNFLDGIDGFVAAHSCLACLLLALFGSANLLLPALLLCACALGFLAHNWHPASIFMGDVGSGALGFLHATLPLAAGSQETDLPLLGAALWLFLGDATLTLLLRAAKGRRFWQAHREHAYQRLGDLGWNHARITLLYLAMAASLIGAYLVFGRPFGPATLILFTLATLTALTMQLLIRRRWAQKKNA
jgi:UDP-N-acetylmuramyl pentapeptide phosphotransferase/UDP-N-acetylglucosamine-1-phosphate transferase